MLNQNPLRKQPQVSVKLLEKVLTQNRRLAEVQKMLYKNKPEMIKQNNSDTIKLISHNDQSNQQTKIIYKDEISQISSAIAPKEFKPLQKKSKMFKNEYSKHIDFLLQKNPQYFEHLAGYFKIFLKLKQEDVNAIELIDMNDVVNSQFTSTYGKDFLKSQSFCNSKDAQLKSDPYYSSFYDSGSKRQFMDSSTVSQVDLISLYYFQCDYQRNSSINYINSKVKKPDLQKRTISLEQSPTFPYKTHYKSEFTNFICLPVINYHQLAKAKNNLTLGKFKLNTKSIYKTSYSNQLDRFIPNQQHQREQSLELFRKALPLQAVSATKSQFSQANAQIREVEKPIHYQYVLIYQITFYKKPQFLPTYQQQYITTSRGTFGKFTNSKLFKQNDLQLSEQQNIEIIRNQLNKID